MALYFVTGNNGKFAEMKALIPEVEQLNVDLLEIQSVDPKIIIKAKINEALKKVEGELIVEDTSLAFDALNGLPGPLIKWFLESLKTSGLATLCEKLGNNKAQAKTIIGYAKEDSIEFFEGIVEGTIVQPSGEGFGWDPIFVPNGSDETFAQMGTEEKNKISHRYKAATKLAEYLKSNG